MASVIRKFPGLLAATLIIAVGAAPAAFAASQSQPASQTQPGRSGKAAKAEKGAKAAKGEKGKKPASAALEGTRWKVTVTPNPAAASKGEKTFEDEFVFAGGKVTMTACVPYGFGASEYKANTAGEGWSFETKQTSASSGTSEWKAKMTGDSVKGTLTWKKADGTVFHYDVEGKKAN